MNYIIMLLGGLLGIFLYSFRKVKGIRKRNPQENYKAVFAQYWKSEWDTVAVSVLVVLSCMFISSEYLNINSDSPTPAGIVAILQYKIASFIKTTFIVVGYCANSIVDAFLGTTEAKLQQKAKNEGANIDN